MMFSDARANAKVVLRQSRPFVSEQHEYDRQR